MSIHELPTFGLWLTLAAYACAFGISARLKLASWFNPVLVSVVIVAFVLLVADISYERYFSSGANWLHYGLGPATVALAIPLRCQLHRLSAVKRQLLATLVFGSILGMGCGAFIARGLGASADLVLALAAKSATAPVAIALVEQAGGPVTPAALFAIGTGLCGAVFGVCICRLAGLYDHIGLGFVMGITAHGIGTARAYQLSYEAGAFAGLGMLLNGVLTAILYPVVVSGFL